MNARHANRRLDTYQESAASVRAKGVDLRSDWIQSPDRRIHGHTGAAGRRPHRDHRAGHGAGARIPGGRPRLRVRVHAAGDAARRRLDARAPERGAAPRGAGDPLLPLRLRAELRGLRVRGARRPARRAAQQRSWRPPCRPLCRRHRRGVRLPAEQGRPPAGRPGGEQERLGGAALAVLPRAVGHAVRAGQLPGWQGIRAGRGGAAVASGSPRAVTGAAGPAVGVDGHGGASTRIADALRTAILDGSYRPGERIRQEDIAARSGASRMPVREALRVLQAEGLVTLVANPGAWVAKLTLAECAELYQIRERLEPLLLRASLPALDGDAVARMTELAD